MVGETFKASVIGQLDDGTAVVFDFGYAHIDSPNVHIDTSIAAGNFQTLVQQLMADALPTDYNFKKYRFACVSGANIGEIGYVDVSPPVAGGLSPVNRYPNELCASLRRSTGYSTRRDRGRVFFGPLATTLIDNANINKVVTDTALVDVASLLKSNLVTQGVTLKPVILSSSGSYNGRVVIKSSVAEVIVHRKTRRPRIGA